MSHFRLLGIVSAVSGALQYEQKPTGSDVGSSSCSGSWRLNRVKFTFNLTTFVLQTQAPTCCPSCCQLTSINTLLRDTGSDKTGRWGIVTTEQPPAENKNMILHSLLHIIMIYATVIMSLLFPRGLRVFQYLCPTIFVSDIAKSEIYPNFRAHKRRPLTTKINIMHLHVFHLKIN